MALNKFARKLTLGLAVIAAYSLIVYAVVDYVQFLERGRAELDAALAYSREELAGAVSRLEAAYRRNEALEVVNADLRAGIDDRLALDADLAYQIDVITERERVHLSEPCLEIIDLQNDRIDNLRAVITDLEAIIDNQAAQLEIVPACELTITRQEAVIAQLEQSFNDAQQTIWAQGQLLKTRRFRPRLVVGAGAYFDPITQGVGPAVFVGIGFAF